MSVQSPKSEDTQQIGIYLLAAELLHLEIDQRLHTVLTESATLELLQQLDPECDSYLASINSSQGFEQAAVHFCSQFILEQTMLVDKIVTQFLEQWAIQLPDSYRELAFDHISLILYVSAVIRQEDPEQAEEFDKAVLNPWVTRLGDSLEGSSVAIYRALGSILKQLPE